MSAAWMWLRIAAVVLTLAPAARAYLLIPDIVYESPGSTRNVLDVILPTSGAMRGQPTIVYIHGGAWHTRDKGDDLAVYIRLTSYGYSVVACNYTLAAAGAPSFPQAIQDVKNVVRWVRTEGQQYNLSPTVVVVGPSSGGHMAQMVATTSGELEFETLTPPLGGYRPQAFVSIAGFSDLEWHVQTYGPQTMFTRFLGASYGTQTVALYQNASPIFHVSPCDPPGGFIHGTADVVVPHQHSLMMADALRAQRKFTIVSLVQDAGHSYEPFGGAIGIADRIAEMIPTLLSYARTPDLNGDGQVTPDDVDAMIELFNARDPRADLNGDKRHTNDDLVLFMAIYRRGC